MQIAVIGAGNGGVAMAAHLTLKGNKVSLYDKFPEALEDIKDCGYIDLKGVVGTGRAYINKVSNNLGDVVNDTELIMVVTPAYAHFSIAKEIAEYLSSDQIIVLHPGRTGGALEFKNTIKKIRPTFEPIVAEAQTLIYACRKTGPTEATIFGIKKQVSFAALPAKFNSLVAEKLQKVFPEFVPVENVLNTSILNIGAIFHPAPCILNAGRIETTQGNFEYYHEGITFSIAKVIEKIDYERLQIAKAFGVKTLSTIEWLKEVYNSNGSDLYSSIQANKVYSGIKAPDSLNTRYISEDVPMSLVPLSELGQLTGIPTPTIDSIINLANILHNKDYRKEGRTLERMGIKNMKVEEIKNLVS